MCEVIFFLSSRSRHTRCGRDWSSDVCSSDLGAETEEDAAALSQQANNEDAALLEPIIVGSWLQKNDQKPPLKIKVAAHIRSEERRVGKECKNRGRRDNLAQRVMYVRDDHSSQ